MTPQEAIIELDNEIAREQFSMLSLDREKPYSNEIIALEIAKQALEKQIPKKPRSVTDPFFGDTTIVCPTCENANLANPFNRSMVYDYCPNCGQALDWSETV